MLQGKHETNGTSPSPFSINRSLRGEFHRIYEKPKGVGSSSTAMLCAPKRDYHGRIHHVVKACQSYSGCPVIPH
jgi:hypothetical protein